MRITYSYKGKEEVFDREKTQVVIGRSKEGVAPDLDLSPDTRVSRQHARMRIENEQYWIEDLNSTWGTQVNGEEIKGKGERELHAGDTIQIGDTTLWVQIRGEPLDPYATLLPGGEVLKSLEEITPSLDASTMAFPSVENVTTAAARRLALFYELPLQFGEETQLDALLQLIVERVVDVIPGAKRGALLVKDQTTGRLALKAHLPVGHPAVSLTMARQAMERRSAFIWPPPASTSEDALDPAQKLGLSIAAYGIESAMYAPLLWRGKALGVVCVDNCESYNDYDSEDLQLLQAVAHHAAMAVANLQLQEEWRRQAEVQNNILRLVSPQLAERLKQQRGRLRLGGEFRDATILISDIRGFTNMSATMSPYDVTEMLEDYFGRLVPLVFEYQGTIDKFVGDAVLAVFGSPDADEQQQLHAVQTAMEMQVAMQEVNAQRAAQGKRTGELGIGIHCGEVVHGFIGTPERMEFTVIGDTVNRASRYCDGARGGEVLISPEVHQWVWNFVEAEQTSIATKHEGNLTAYRVKRTRGLKD